MSEPLRETLSASDPLPRPAEPPITNPDGQTLATQHGNGDVPQTRLESEPAAVPVESPELHAVPGYVIEGELGRGGMGVVYKARQAKLGRTVALKMFLRAEHASGEERLRFQREAEALGKLRHENIVQVYEVGEHRGSPFYSLEFVDGGTLHQYLGGKPMPPRQAARLVEMLARAMHAAREAGLVHRDLKPANILLQGRTSGASASSADPAMEKEVSSVRSAGASEGGELPHPKITDFGLVKDVKASGQTRSGELLGTPSYMAPEQASGRVHEV